MTKATITFQKIVQDSQDYGTFEKNNDHMVSIIHFTLEIKGNKYEDMKVEVRQPYGTDYETEPIEVGKISDSYKGPWNHEVFSEICEECYRSCVGSQGHAIKSGKGSNLRMRDNVFEFTVTKTIDIPEDGSSAW